MLLRKLSSKWQQFALIKRLTLRLDKQPKLDWILRKIIQCENKDLEAQLRAKIAFGVQLFLRGYDCKRQTKTRPEIF